MAPTITSWNIQGRQRPDLVAIADEIRRVGADVVLLQEVQRSQAYRLGRQLDMAVTWRLKHWPIVAPPEGLAVLSSRPPVRVRRVVLAHRSRFWSWKRRIAIRTDLITESGPLTAVDIHLGSGVGGRERARQIEIVLDLAGRRDGPDDRIIVGGDVNAGPSSAAVARFTAAGFVDAWRARHGDAPGATNWSPGPRTGAPNQRIDYLFVPVGQEIESISLPVDETSASADIVRHGAWSDHLPLTVTLS